jgi:hypothetical protein
MALTGWPWKVKMSRRGFSGPQPLNSVVRYGTFHHGVQRFDIDLPPGIIRVRVAPVPSAPANDAALIEVGGSGGGGARQFKLAEGFQGDHFGAGYGEFTVSVKTMDHKSVLASEHVRLSEKQPDAEVTLTPVLPRNLVVLASLYLLTRMRRPHSRAHQEKQSIRFCASSRVLPRW